MIIVNNWTLRRYLLWPWCARRKHPYVFTLESQLNGVPCWELRRCSCGRRTARFYYGHDARTYT